MRQCAGMSSERALSVRHNHRKVSPPEIRDFEDELLSAYSVVVGSFHEALARVGLVPEVPSLRRWSEDDPASYGSEIEMSLLRDGEIEDALDVLIYASGERQVQSAEELRSWLTGQLRELTGSL